MTDLSPAAQKVLDAATAPTKSFCLENVNEIAAALHTAADQIAPTKQDYEEASHEFATVFLNGVAYAVNEMRLIATELENAQ